MAGSMKPSDHCLFISDCSSFLVFGQALYSEYLDCLASGLRSILNAAALIKPSWLNQTFICILSMSRTASYLFWRTSIFYVVSRRRLFILHHMNFSLIGQMSVDGIEFFRIYVAFSELAVLNLFQDETQHFAVSDV